MGVLSQTGNSLAELSWIEKGRAARGPSSLATFSFGARMDEFPDAPQGTTAARIFRVVLRLILLLILAYSVHLLVAWFSARTADIHPGAQVGMLLVLLLAYALLIAVPFVPGIEIGLMLLAVEGAWIAPWIYLATVAGLLFAYGVGEWVPYARLHQILADLHMRRACALLEHIHPLSREKRVMLLRDNAPKWLRPFISRYRYLFVAAVINLPGNAMIGGGGGILFLTGLSRLVRPAAVALTLALAVMPVPLAAWVFGIDIIP